MLFKFVTVIYSVHRVTAFMMITPSCHTRHYCYHHQNRCALFSSTLHQQQQDWSIDAIEEARQHFEYIIGPMIFDDSQNHPISAVDDGGATKNGSGKTDSLPNHVTITTPLVTNKKPHLLTNAQRKRRQMEIGLLQSLLHSDDAIDEIMSLWIHECPSQIVNTNTIQFLSTTDASCTIQEAEDIFRNILQPQQSSSAAAAAEATISVWPEPAARLAYVLFVQQRYTECDEYVQAVLSVKPWHFEMVQLQVLLALSSSPNSNNNRDHIYNAIRITRQCGLPPLGQRKRRDRWVRTAVRQAQEQLQQLEDYTETEISSLLQVSSSSVTTTTATIAAAEMSTWQ